MLGVAGSVGAAPSVAAADDAQAADPQAVEQVRQLGTSGLAKYDQGDFAGALAEFDRAREILYTPTLELYAARSLVSLGRLATASARYRQIVEAPLAPNASEAFKKATDDARQEYATLKSRIPRLTISIEPPGAADVTIDGEPVSPGTTVEVDPGDHAVVATRGAERASSDVAIAEGERQTVTLRFASVAAPPADDTGDDGTLQRTLGFVALGVGAVGVGVGVGAGLAAMGKKGDLEDQGCTPDACEAGRFDDEVDSYNSLRTVSSIGFIAGLVVAAGGVVLVLTAPTGSAESAGVAPTALRVRVSPSFVATELSF